MIRCSLCNAPVDGLSWRVVIPTIFLAAELLKERGQRARPEDFSSGTVIPQEHFICDPCFAKSDLPAIGDRSAIVRGLN